MRTLVRGNVVSQYLKDLCTRLKCIDLSRLSGEVCKCERVRSYVGTNIQNMCTRGNKFLDKLSSSLAHSPYKERLLISPRHQG